MKTYHDFLQYILDNGTEKPDRTGTGTLNVFGYQMRFNLQEGFPLVTTKKIHLRSVIYELLWFLKGDTNIKYLNDNNVTIWNEWADNNGDLGLVYGHQWRKWQRSDGYRVDQIQNVITQLKQCPDSRRHVVSAWNVGDLHKMALPPCHLLFQFYVVNNKLSCMLTQRSADAFLGVPFNIASYAIITHIIAHLCNLDVGEFIWSGGDCHIYSNHIEQVNTQLQREPFELPTLELVNPPDYINDFTFDNFKVVNYQSHPAIKAHIAI